MKTLKKIVIASTLMLVLNSLTSCTETNEKLIEERSEQSNQTEYSTSQIDKGEIDDEEI